MTSHLNLPIWLHQYMARTWKLLNIDVWLDTFVSKNYSNWPMTYHHVFCWFASFVQYFVAILMDTLKHCKYKSWGQIQSFISDLDLNTSQKATIDVSRGKSRNSITVIRWKFNNICQNFKSVFLFFLSENHPGKIFSTDDCNPIAWNQHTFCYFNLILITSFIACQLFLLLIH